MADSLVTLKSRVSQGAAPHKCGGWERWNRSREVSATPTMCDKPTRARKRPTYFEVPTERQQGFATSGAVQQAARVAGRGCGEQRLEDAGAVQPARAPVAAGDAGRRRRSLVGAASAGGRRKRRHVAASSANFLLRGTRIRTAVF